MKLQTDKTLKASIALPAAAGTAVTSGIDLGATTLGPTGDNFRARVKVPATANLANTKTLTLSIEDSADNVTFTTLIAGADLVITGPSSGGGAALEKDFQLPSHTARYIRLSCVAASASGDVTGQTMEIALTI